MHILLIQKKELFPVVSPENLWEIDEEQSDCDDVEIRWDELVDLIMDQKCNDAVVGPMRENEERGFIQVVWRVMKSSADVDNAEMVKEKTRGHKLKVKEVQVFEATGELEGKGDASVRNYGPEKQKEEIHLRQPNQ